MLKLDQQGANGKAANAQQQDVFFLQYLPLPNPLNPREIQLHVLPGSGIPIRDYFATKALATCTDSWAGGEPGTARDVAEWCYRVADAMLKARES